MNVEQKNKKIYINNSNLMEFIDYISSEITFQKFGQDSYAPSSEVGQEDVLMFQEDAQDFYNSKYDEIEYILNKTLSIFSDTIE